MNKKIEKKIKQYLLISFGVILMNIGFYFFLDPINLCLGGVMGLAVLLKPFYSQLGPWFTASIFMYIVNIICLIIGGLCLGKDFFLKTIYATLFSPTIVLILENTCNKYFFLETISDFKIDENGVIAGASTYLVAIAVAILLIGFGIGIAVKNNGSTGGMDVIQRVISKYAKIPLSKTMYLTDWVLVFIAGLSIFRGVEGFSYNIETVLFGSLGVLGMGYVVDTIALNVKNRRTAFIVTTKPDEIKELIYKEVNRGVTFTNASGAYTGESKTMLICTMDKNEAYRLMPLIETVDEHAFSFVTSCKEVKGEY